MRNIALTLAYDGTRYFGWQKTSLGPSIEEEVQHAVEKILQHEVRLQAASRTDRGVHADGQVINFVTKKETALNELQHSINSLLPEDIAVLQIEEKDQAFHPTLDAVSKAYRYKIACTQILHPLLRKQCWHCPYPVDIELMAQAATRFIGKRDFSSLRNQRNGLVEEDSVREIFHIDIKWENPILLMTMHGNNFLYKMARNIVGTLLYVGQKKIPTEAITEILESRDRTKAGVTAPAHGLTLHRVYYRSFADTDSMTMTRTTPNSTMPQER